MSIFRRIVVVAVTSVLTSEAFAQNPVRIVDDRRQIGHPKADPAMLVAIAYDANKAKKKVAELFDWLSWAQEVQANPAKPFPPLPSTLDDLGDLLKLLELQSEKAAAILDEPLPPLPQYIPIDSATSARLKEIIETHAAFEARLTVRKRVLEAAERDAAAMKEAVWTIDRALNDLIQKGYDVTPSQPLSLNFIAIDQSLHPATARYLTAVSTKRKSIDASLSTYHSKRTKVLAQLTAIQSHYPEFEKKLADATQKFLDFYFSPPAPSVAGKSVPRSNPSAPSSALGWPKDISNFLYIWSR